MEGLPFWRQLVVVFDADMVASPQFYTRVLAELADPQVTGSITYALLISCTPAGSTG